VLVRKALELARPFLRRPVREKNVVVVATSVRNAVAVRKTIRLFPNRWLGKNFINEWKTLEFRTNRAMRECCSIIRESLHARLHGESSIFRL